MRLLIITQKVDKNDDILGFFHRWLLEFARHFEFITVIALQVGKYDLPENVKVLSLGKGLPRAFLGGDKLRYIYKFYKYIWVERKNYDAVFVHMNQEYVLLGWKFWKLFGKKIFLWRNHANGNLMTRFAILFSNRVFCTSPQSFTARFKKTKIMPVGIDTDFFKPDSSVKKKPNSILFLGRLDPVKNVDIFIEALNILDKQGVMFIAGVYGNSVKNKEYYKKIKKQSVNLEKKGKLIFHKSISNMQTPSVYNQYQTYVNTTLSGSFDKTILEAMACGCTVVVSNKALKLSEEFLFEEENALSLSEKLKAVLSISENEKKEYIKTSQQYVVENSLAHLTDKLFADFIKI
jgi:glycosyltransferase involved in cell wall biosynthesis